MTDAKVRILIVEDEAIIVEDLRLLLRRLGYHVIGTAACGPSAIRMAKENCPDVVLMDVRLHGEMDGVEAARQIRLVCPVPVIYITAYAATLANDFSDSGGVYSCLAKPFSPAQLRSTLQTALSQRHAS
jgi:two-component system cell cycle sensor histidine kinase/response regulator CckA